ncbi:MAG: type II secretion system protein [Patescibacteria group bacterium]
MSFFFHSIVTKRGFTLLELMVVLGVMAVLLAATAGYYRGFSTNVELDAATRVLRADLRDVSSRATTGQDTRKWGLHLVNGATQYYELFSTPSNYADGAKVVYTTTRLPGNVVFTAPAPSSTLDVVFDRITGATSVATITLALEGKSSTITVSALGTID